MKLTPTLLEIFGSIDLSSREGAIKAYKEGCTNYTQIETIVSDPDLYNTSSDNSFDMEELITLSAKKIESYVKSRRDRIRTIFQKHIGDEIIGYIVCGKAEVRGGKDISQRVYFDNPIFKEKATSYGYEENPQTEEARDKNLSAMRAVGNEAIDVIEKAVLSLWIYLSRKNKELHSGDYTEEERHEQSKYELGRTFGADYTEEEITSFEIAVIAAFDNFINGVFATMEEAIIHPSTNDYLNKAAEAVNTLRFYSRLMLMDVYKEMGVDEGKPVQERRYTPEQYRFVWECLFGGIPTELWEALAEEEEEEETDNE